MPYVAVCNKCNYHEFGLERSLVEDLVDLHGISAHGVANTIVARISKEDYNEYLKYNSTEAFWLAIRRYKKLAKLMR